MRWVVCGLLISGVVGCHSATKQEQMQAAQNDLLKEAMALQQCELGSGFASDRCADQRAAYNRDLAAFRTKYGR